MSMLLPPAWLMVGRFDNAPEQPKTPSRGLERPCTRTARVAGINWRNGLLLPASLLHMLTALTPLRRNLNSCKRAVMLAVYH